MTLKRLLTFNAILYIALGIAFALYGPLMIAMFGVLETGGDALIYWYVVSFARLFGVGLFGYGFLLLAARPLAANPDQRKPVLMALVIANLIGLVVAAVQQVSIWGIFAGWAAVLVFLLLTAGYAYFLAAKTA